MSFPLRREAMQTAERYDGQVNVQIIPQSGYWLSSQMVEMRIWRASEYNVRATLEKDTGECGAGVVRESGRR